MHEHGWLIFPPPALFVPEITSTVRPPLTG
jgi:hypothetical protein